MKTAKLNKKISKTWKKLLQANLHHDESQTTNLMKKMIKLEIKQKNRHI